MDKDRYLIRIVDDEPDVREALALMLAIEGWKSAIYESAHQFLTQNISSIPGCLLLDVRMPNMTGIELQAVMAERHIRLPIVFLTGHADIHIAIDALKKGAHDFLLKPVDDQKLLDTIASAIAADDKARAGVDGAHRVEDGLAKLSDREKEILRLFMDGLTDKVVAERYGISERTVQGHRARIYEKFGLHTAKELKTLSDEIRLKL